MQGSYAHFDRPVTTPTDNFVRYEIYTIHFVGMPR